MTIAKNINGCRICGMELKRGTVGHPRKVDHMRAKHPEYEFRYEYMTADHTSGSAYICSTCGQTCTSIAGIAGIIDHYQLDHPECLKVEPKPVIGESKMDNPTEREIKRYNTCTTCEICGIKLGNQSKFIHMKKHHPEFPFTHNEKRQPACGICGSVGSYRAVIKHMRRSHEEIFDKVKPEPVKSWEQEADLLTQLVAALKEEREINAQLREKLKIQGNTATKHAALLIEAQNLLAHRD